MGNWDPEKISFQELFDQSQNQQDLSKPYPFFLAHPLESEPQELGSLDEWQAEWKWDGIRGQIISRDGEVFIWSRGEELVNEKFPELVEFALQLPSGTVLDGEILAFQSGQPLPFSLLQTRIGRKNVSKKILKDAPVSFLAYDLLEWEGKDFREKPLSTRRSKLESLFAQVDHSHFELSAPLTTESWEKLAIIREDSRAHFAEGLMLKHKKQSLRDRSKAR